MSGHHEGITASSLDTELLRFTMVHQKYEIIPEDMRFDIITAAEETLSHGNEGILAAAQALDGANHLALADEESSMVTGVHGKLMNIYQQHLERESKTATGITESKEEYGRLLVQKIYARRRFAVLYTSTICRTMAEVQAMKARKDFIEAQAATIHLVLTFRDQPKHLPAYLWNVL